MNGNTQLISYCGLYCGSCPKYLKGKCSGCEGYEKATWCKIRTCCREKAIQSCADCDQYPDVKECRYHSSTMAKILSVVFNSNRPAAIALIQEHGYEKFADYMAANKMITIKKRGENPVFGK